MAFIGCLHLLGHGLHGLHGWHEAAGAHRLWAWSNTWAAGLEEQQTDDSGFGEKDRHMLMECHMLAWLIGLNTTHPDAIPNWLGADNCLLHAM